MSRRPFRDAERARREFVAEGERLLDQAFEAILALAAEIGEKGEAPPETLNALFRAVHSLKGLAGMLGEDAVAALSHELESLLDGFRLGLVEISPENLALSRQALTALRETVAGVDAAGETLGDSDEVPSGSSEGHHPLLRELRTAASAREPIGSSPEGADDASSSGLDPALDSLLSDYERHRLREGRRRGRAIALLTIEVPYEEIEIGLKRAMDAVAKTGELIGTFPAATASDPSRMGFRLLAAVAKDADLSALARDCGATATSMERLDGEGDGRNRPGDAKSDPKSLAAALGIATASGSGPLPSPPARATPRVASATVRVSLEKINHLIDVAGELAMARWTLRRPLEEALAASSNKVARFAAQRAFAEIDRAATALSRAALATRLVPVSQITSRLQNFVRATAASLGKEVELTVHGSETELDKVLADELAEPVMHLVRNALDHGIETPSERLAAGKPARGAIALAVRARGREVVLTLSDDGRGIEPAAIVERAREKGLLGPGEAPPLDPLTLIFRPGFSTAREVSSLSGRGVGLDVVRANLASSKGSVTVHSLPGKGTTFEVVVPSTLVLVESLLVRAGGLSFALPTSGIARTFRADPSRVEFLDGRRVISDEGRPLPLEELTRLLGIDSPRPAPEPAERPEIVLVAEQGLRRAGLLVSATEGIQDLIVKSLSDSIPRAREITGATELAGGELALTLDPALLVESVLQTTAVGGIA